MTNKFSAHIYRFVTAPDLHIKPKYQLKPMYVLGKVDNNQT